MSTNTVSSNNTIPTQSLHQLRVFVCIVEQGTLTAAAQALGITKSVVSAHLRRLETELGVRLLERTTRQMALTQVGQQVFSSASRMVQAAEDALAAAAAEVQQVRGLIRVACPVDLAPVILLPVIRRLRKAHPELRIDAVVSDLVVDLIGAQVDLAIRLGRPRDSSLIMRRIARTDEAILASPALRERLGPLSTPADLAQAPWIEHMAVGLRGTDFEAPSLGQHARLPEIQPALRVDSTDLMRTLAKEGHGLMVMPLIVAKDDLKQGQLVRVLPAWRRHQVELYVVMPSKSQSRRRAVFLQAVLDTAEGL